MDNDGHRTGLEEAASAGKTAADAARIGKAISKGTAAGGAWGAVAAAAIEGREYIGKLLTGAAILLLLPVLFILMLPSLIFGGLTESGTEGNVLPVLNDSAAISAHYDAAASSVNQILNEGIEDAKTRIAEHFATTEGDCCEVINPYEDGLGCNVNIFFAEYCSAKNEAWSEINDNLPFGLLDELEPEPFERYSPLDDLGLRTHVRRNAVIKGFSICFRFGG